MLDNTAGKHHEKHGGIGFSGLYQYDSLLLISDVFITPSFKAGDVHEKNIKKSYYTLYCSWDSPLLRLFSQ